jgi:archaetidylinositol phosphate synthase
LVLDSKRGKVEFILTPMAKSLTRFSPNAISGMSLIVAVFAALATYFSPEHWQILLPLVTILVLVSGLFDALDGKVARLTGKTSKRGDFLDHVLDRYADVLMIGAVAVSAWCNPYLGMAAIIGVLLTSYMGTQAQAVGAGRRYSGLLGRADRIVLSLVIPLVQFVIMYVNGDGWLTFGSVRLSAFELMMLWFAVVGNITAIQRAWGTWKELEGK